MNKKLNILKIIICVLIITISIISFNYSPDSIVINYSLSGEPNYAVSRVLGLLIFPIIVILLYFLEKTKIPKIGSD
jgi:uncharacterized membrane protein